MMTVPAPDGQGSLPYSRARDARIFWLLDSHPVTAAMLVEIGWFPCRNKALRRLGRLVQRKRIRLVGTVTRKQGRPEHVYSRCRVKGDQLLHEVQMTWFFLRLHAAKVLRGRQLESLVPRADAEVWINGRRLFVEWDRGTMGYAQVVRDRFRHYEKATDLVLWICPTEARREGLRKRAAGIRHAALFATAADALADPHAPIWVDYGGKRGRLPKQDGPAPAEEGARAAAALPAKPSTALPEGDAVALGGWVVEARGGVG